MREILFRGKRLNVKTFSVTTSNEWVYGYYIKDAINTYIYSSFDNPKMVSVDLGTVGQYTGLTDKNGTKIFEGDIIKTKKYGKIVGHSNVNSYDIFTVEYAPAVFRLVNHSRGFNLVGNGADYEVIGNIHDNSELLEKNNE